MDLNNLINELENLSLEIKETSKDRLKSNKHEKIKLKKKKLIVDPFNINNKFRKLLLIKQIKN